jgi:hypothetical protein
VCKFKGYGGGG